MRMWLHWCSASGVRGPHRSKARTCGPDSRNTWGNATGNLTNTCKYVNIHKYIYVCSVRILICVCQEGYTGVDFITSGTALLETWQIHTQIHTSESEVQTASYWLIRIVLNCLPPISFLAANIYTLAKGSYTPKKQFQHLWARTRRASDAMQLTEQTNNATVSTWWRSSLTLYKCNIHTFEMYKCISATYSALFKCVHLKCIIV